MIIGIEDYFQLPDVPGAAADADLIADLLADTRGIPRSRLRLVTHGASREQILAAVDEVATLAADGVAWLYFAGHGAASPSTGERLLLGDDARPDLAVFEPRAVAVADLTARLTARGARAVLLLDTCYTGVDRGGDPLFGKRFAVPTSMLAPASQALVWTATTPGEWSGVLPGAGHGAFTWAVAGALRGWADTDQDGTVDAAEASIWVGEALATLQVRDQHPVMEGSDLTSWSLVTGDLETAPDLRPDAATPGSDDYVETLEAMADQQAALRAAHDARTDVSRTQAQSIATAEWRRIRELGDTDPRTAVAGIDAFLARWHGHTVEVDGILEPVDVPELAEAEALGRELRLALALPTHGLVPPVVRLSGTTDRFVDATDNVMRGRDLYALLNATSELCAGEVAYRRRAKVVWPVTWGTVLGSAALGTVLVVADPQLTTEENVAGENQVTGIGPMGITGFTLMGSGLVLGTLAVPYAVMGRAVGSEDGFDRCVREATD